MQNRAAGHDLQCGVGLSGLARAVDDQRVAAALGGRPDECDVAMGGQVPASTAADGADVDHAVGQHRLDGHGVCVVVVADRDQIGEREVGQRAGQLVEIHLDAHDLRIGRRAWVLGSDRNSPRATRSIRVAPCGWRSNCAQVSGLRASSTWIAMAATHPTWADRRQRSWDIDRIALLEAMGWTVIRVSAEMLSRPWVIIERVRVNAARRWMPRLTRRLWGLCTKFGWSSYIRPTLVKAVYAGAGWRPRTSLPGRASVGTPFSAITSPDTTVAT